MSYVPTDWVDDVTPVDAANMDHIEQGIVDAHAGLPPTPVNGKWLKGSGGAMVWDSPAIADVTGLQAALDAKQAIVQKGVANGYAGLGADGVVPATQLPLGGLVRFYDSLLSSSGTFDVQNIPQVYAGLRIVVYGRSTESLELAVAMLAFNGDFGTNYDLQQVRTAAATTVGNEFFATGGKAGNLPGATAVANSFSAITIEIPHYAGTVNHKTWISQWTEKLQAATGKLATATLAGFWRNAAAINRIGIYSQGGSQLLVAGSRCTVYGMGAS